MTTETLIAALSDFVTNHTTEGVSHAPELADSFLAYVGGSHGSRPNVIRWLQANGHCDRHGKTCFRKLVAGGDIPVHPILGVPVVR